MKHFLKKNISNLQGAGGKKGGSPPSPPPAELQPPKLGKLQTLASYSYAETIDLVSDGPIEGFVNQNGQYVQGSRIFESIYFDNTPVKKSFDLSYTGSNPVATTGYSLAATADNIYNLWFVNNEFQDKAFTGVNQMIATGSLTGNLVSGRNPRVLKYSSYFADNTTVNDPYLSLTIAPVTHTGNTGNLFTCPDPYVRERQCEIMWNRNDIAKSIYKGVDLLNTVANSPEIYGSDASSMAKIKSLRFNFQNWADLKEAVLPFYLNRNEDDYPIFAVKFDIGSPYRESVESSCGNPLSYFDANEKQVTVSSDFTLTQDTSIVLKNDIANQVFEKIEIEEIGKKIPIRPISYIDLTYASKTTSTNIDIGGSIIIFGFKKDRISPTEESVQAIKDFIESLVIVRPDNEKYNYSNVLAEIRTGEDLQPPLSYFNKIYVDREYGTKLIGPFDVSKQVLRITNFDDDSGYNIRGTYEFPLAGATADEGSSDTRSSKSYSSYAGNGRTVYVEEAIPITHIVENPNVNQVFITIGVRALNDTNQIDSSLPGIGSVQAGSRIPTVVRFKVEIGLLDSYGKDVSSSIEERIYQIIGMADSPALIDIGRTEVSDILNNYKFLSATRDSNEINASTAISLPDVENNARRFIRVTRTTYETSSVLVKREISLEKVTEIINTKFSYPGSAIIGTKIDSRTLSAIPPRSFDLRLKRVLVPSNYYPLHPDGKDKRRYRTSTDFDAATTADLHIYKGNWDGTFKEAWTDNPAWVLFDILTDVDDGLGSFVDPDQINIWELYKIGRFCDAVDKDGYFYGVPNSLGGKEPRYSINVIMADKINVFDTLNSVASVFRGNIFYNNSLIDFTDDRLKVPVLEFSNANVKDGTFSYTNSRKDQEFNAVEVSYLDENDNFKPKIEYVENADDIRKRGVLKTTIDSFGVTSKTLANRIGKHVLYATTKENQSISFIGGVETLFLKPGELISINDELKTQQRNFGRVLEIDADSGLVYVNEKFPSGYCFEEITLFAPTGTKSYQELAGQARISGGLTFKDIHESDVPQVQTFKISGYDNSPNYGANIYIQPKTEYPLITFTGASSVSGTGLYSGTGYYNNYMVYSGVFDTGYYIAREKRAVTVIVPDTPAAPPTNLNVYFGAVETGVINFVFNGNLYDFEFANGVPTGTYGVDISSFTGENQMADALVTELEGQISYISLSADGYTTIITNSQSGASANTEGTSAMPNVTFDGGGYGSDLIPGSSGQQEAVDVFWSLNLYSATGAAIYSGASGASQPYSGSWFTGGCVYTPSYDNPNRDFLYRVKQASPYSITMSGIEREIYKVASIREENINEYAVSAVKFDTGKFAEIENTQTLDDFYSTFDFIQRPTTVSASTSEAVVYQLDTPTINAFVSGDYDGQNDTLDISGSWSSVNGATSYLVNMIAPNGQKTTIDQTGLSYVFQDQSQLGFYRLLVSAKNQSLGQTSKTVSSGINVFATDTYITPYIKGITLN